MFQGLTGHDDMPVTSARRTRMEERCGVFKDREAAQCYIDVGGEDEVTVTSEPHKHMSTERTKKQAASTGGEHKNPERGTAAISRSICASNGAPIHVAGAKLGFKLLTVPLIK